MLRQLNLDVFKFGQIPLLGLWETSDAEFDGSILRYGIFFIFYLEFPLFIFFSSLK